MRTEGAEVEVLVAGDAAHARLPPPVLMVPACVDKQRHRRRRAGSERDTAASVTGVGPSRQLRPSRSLSPALP